MIPRKRTFTVGIGKAGEAAIAQALIEEEPLPFGFLIDLGTNRIFWIARKRICQAS